MDYLAVATLLKEVTLYRNHQLSGAPQRGLDLLWVPLPWVVKCWQAHSHAGLLQVSTASVSSWNQGSYLEDVFLQHTSPSFSSWCLWDTKMERGDAKLSDLDSFCVMSCGYYRVLPVSPPSTVRSRSYPISFPSTGRHMTTVCQNRKIVLWHKVAWKEKALGTMETDA